MFADTQSNHEDGPGPSLTSETFSLETQNLLHEFLSNDPAACHDKAQIRIRQLEDEIRALKRACNVAAPIERLPPEVLTYIFEILRQYSLVDDDYKWLATTHVCGRWRSAALDCADLWTRIDLSQNSDMADAMLQRSEGAPLSLQFDARFSPATEQKSHRFQQTLLHQAKRLRSVTVFAGDKTFVSQLLDIKSFPLVAPALETICIEGALKRFQQMPRWFGKRAYPSLRELTVAGCVIPWKTLPSTPRLTFLKLGTSSDGGTRPSMKAFLRSLCSMPELKHLDLSNILPDHGNLPLPNSPSLPTLQTLVLDDGADRIFDFFRCCRTIMADRVHLTMLGSQRITPDGNNSIVRCLSALSQVWKNPTTASYQVEGGVHSLKLTGFDQDLWDPCIECTFQPDSDEAELTLGFNNPTFHPILDIAKSLDLSPLHSLSLHDCGLIPGALWTAVFADLTKLETLEFVQSSTKTFVVSLAEGTVMGTEQTGPPPLSGLKLVVVKGVVSNRDTELFSLGNLVTLATSPHTGIGAVLEELRIVDTSISRMTDHLLKSGQEAHWKTRVVLENVRILDRAPDVETMFDRIRSFLRRQNPDAYI